MVTCTWNLSFSWYAGILYHILSYALSWHVLFSCLFFARVQDQVSGVISVMRDNINRVLDRGEKLEDLEEKSGVCVCVCVCACTVCVCVYYNYLCRMLLFSCHSTVDHPIITMATA